MQTNTNKYYFLIFILLLGNLFVWKEIYHFLSHPGLRVVFFDIGQGDAIFIETFQGHQILIDGGGNRWLILKKLAKEMPFWDRSLDLVILTHPDSDHLRGLVEVLKRFKVENILWNGVEKPTYTFKRWKENLEKEKGNKLIAQAGQKIEAGILKIFILYPFQNLKGKFLNRATNDTSVVSYFLFGKNKFLFTGDITQKVEKELIECYSFKLDSDILKIAHHGSKTSSSKEFLEKVSPKFGIISCAKNNPYHFPHQEVLQRLKEFGIKILRTDQKGDIKIVSDGNYLGIKK